MWANRTVLRGVGQGFFPTIMCRSPLAKLTLTTLYPRGPLFPGYVFHFPPFLEKRMSTCLRRVRLDLGQVDFQKYLSDGMSTIYQLVSANFFFVLLINLPIFLKKLVLSFVEDWYHKHRYISHTGKEAAPQVLKLKFWKKKLNNNISHRIGSEKHEPDFASIHRIILCPQK